MELEKIVSTILEKVGNTDVSPQTVTTLVSLKPVAEGAEPDDAYFDEMARAVKSVQGNVNNVFSTKLSEQVNAKVEEYKKSHKAGEPKPKGEPSDKDMPEWARQMKAELERERNERQQERAERERKDLLATVRKGLEDKFEKSGSKVNGYFARQALSKLQVPEKDADVRSLVDEAERLYNADIKEAGFTPDAPRAGGGNGGSAEKADEHLWDDVAKIVGRDRPQPQS